MLLINFTINFLLIINVILIGGVLPLIESKYLSLIKRSVGPKFVGYNGSLQFIADALNMFLNGCLIPNEVNNFFFLFWPSVVFSLCIFFWINTFWGVNIIYFEIEYNIVLLTLLSVFINISIMLTGYFSNNNYALFSSVSTLLVFFCLEILLGVLFLTIFFFTSSFHIMSVYHWQDEYPLIIVFVIVLNLLLVIILIEINNSPFDLTEAESELISGYHLEYGAFFFALFYLGEYFHLFFVSVFFVFLLFGFY